MHTLATLVGPSALAVKELSVDPEGNNGRYVRIVGRKSGLTAWLLDLIKIDSTTEFEVFKDHIRYAQANLSGRTTTVIPLSSISILSSGYFKPLLYLILGVIGLLAGLIIARVGAAGLLFIGLGLILIVYYFLHKTLVLTATSHSGIGATIAFKRSVIEGVKVEEKQAEEIIKIINTLVLEQ